MGLSSRKRDTVDPPGMLDLLLWWEDIEGESGRLLTVKMTRAATTPGRFVTCVVEARKPSIDAAVVPEAAAQLRWPTASHKTVLAALLWLMMDVQQQLEASDSLNLFSPVDKP